MLLCTVQFLCSVVAAFARLVRVLHKAAMATTMLCSPVPTPSPAVTGVGGIATPISSRRKVHVHPVVVAGGVKDQQQQLSVALVPPAVAVLGDGGVEEAEPTMKKKAAWAARRRPSRLVLPAVADAAGEALLAAEEAAEKEKEKEEAEAEVEGNGFWLASRRGARHAMEDGYAVITDAIGVDHTQLAFYGVYDGHGGRAAVDFVAGHLSKNVVAAAVLGATRTIAAEEARASASASSSTAEDHVAAAIRDAYVATDSEFLSQGLRGGACAATALVIDGDLYVANLGDCRAVMSRDGSATALTSDHTAARDDERARIESSGGYVSCGSNGVWRVQDCLAVSRAFGDGGLKRWVVAEPEITKTRLVAGCEFLVIASDGLWNKVSNQEAVDAVVSAAGAATSSECYSVGSCRRLVEMARGRGSRDDITVMVVDLKRFLR